MRRSLSFVLLVFALAVLVIAAHASAAFAQGSDSRPSDHLSFGEHEGGRVESTRPDSPSQGRPDFGGRDHSVGRPDGGGSDGRSPAARPDPYPALTQANRVYQEALARWQRAHEAYQNARARQAALKAKYVNESGEVRPGWDYYSAVTVLRAADDAVMQAWYDLDRAEHDRNAAHGRAAQEFRNATEQFARAQQARAAEAERRQREYQREIQSDRRGDRGGH